MLRPQGWTTREASKLVSTGVFARIVDKYGGFLPFNFCFPIGEEKESLANIWAILDVELRTSNAAGGGLM
jgi:hypothetical protein